MAKAKNMENQHFHLYVSGKLKTVFKSKKGKKVITYIERERFDDLDKFLTADELGYVKDNDKKQDQNAFMFDLISKCKDLDELKAEILKRYNEYRGSHFKRESCLEEIDNILLCVPKVNSGKYQMPTYVDGKESYSVVPFMFKEAFTSESSFGSGSKASIAKDSSNINNPYNMLRDTILTMIENNRKGKYQNDYQTYYETIIRNARLVFERILRTRLDGCISHYENAINKLIAQNEYLKEEEKSGKIKIFKVNGEYKVKYKHEAFANDLVSSLQDYVTVQNQEDKSHIGGLYDDVCRERNNIKSYTSIGRRDGKEPTLLHNEAFLINVFENEADLFKYGNISGNSIKFYIILAQFANQIKLHEIKRIMSEQENAYFPFKLDMRKFSSLYPTDDVEYELAARGSVKDVVDLFTKYNQSASSLGDVDLANEESSDEDLSEFDKIISAHLDNKSNYETNFQRVLEKRNPERLL